MPWKACKPMDERLKFIARLLDGEQMAGLLREFGISTCSAIERASSTSMPRYLTVLSILCRAGHRIDYVPCRTMSCYGRLSRSAARW